MRVSILLPLQRVAIRIPLAPHERTTSGHADEWNIWRASCGLDVAAVPGLWPRVTPGYPKRLIPHHTAL